MNILALETSTAIGGAALVVDGKVQSVFTSRQLRSHSELLNPFIEQCLKEGQLELSDIDIFAVGQGPGSFTGVRVADNAAKTFSYCYQKPIIAIDSLSLLAYAARASQLPVLSIINAFKNMVYLGLFDVSGVTPKYITGPEAVPVRELSKVIQSECVVVGDGWEAYSEFFPDSLKQLMVRDPSFGDDPLASTLGELAYLKKNDGPILDWKSFLPLYIRASEAEENKKGILIQPLK